MADLPPVALISMKSTDWTVSPRDRDPRGLEAVASDREAVGMVLDLILDEVDRNVHFLVLSLDGVFDVGGVKQRLVPVEAITRIDGKVYLRTSWEDVARSPDYAPELVADLAYYAGVFGHYGYTPYWGARAGDRRRHSRG